MLRLKVTPVVGLPQFTGWSQVAESTASASARLICVFAISGKHAGNVGRDINEQISDFYYYDAQQLHEFLLKIIAYAHENECKMYFACAILHRGKSVFATYGGAVFLKRQEKSGKILESDFDIRVVEGSYVPDDVFVLTTLQATQFLSEIQLKFQQGYDSDIIITSVVPGLHAQTDSSLSALVFISKDDEPEHRSHEAESAFFETELEHDEFSNKNSQGSDFQARAQHATAQQTTRTDLESQRHGFVQGEGVSQGEGEISVDEQQNQEKVAQNTQQEELFSSASGVSDQVETPGASVSIEIDSHTAESKLVAVFGAVKKSLTLFGIGVAKVAVWLWNFLVRFFKKIVRVVKSIDVRALKEQVSQVKSEGIGAVFRKKTVYMVESKPRKGVIKFIIVVALLLIGLAGFGFVSYSRSKERERITQLLSPIQSSFVQAQEQLDTDPIAARELLNQTVQKTEVLEKEQSESSAVSLITAKKQELADYLESISGREELNELDIFYDARLVKSDFIASGIDLRDSQLLLYDSGMKQLLIVQYDTKQVTAFDLSEYEAVRSAVLNEGEIYVLTDGIYKIQASEGSQPEEVRSEGDSNEAALLLDAYDRYVYVVNPEKRNIYRYAEGEEGYSEPVGWMKSATGIQYDELRSIAVDGDVWLTTLDGQLKKFTSGREESFAIRGLETGFSTDIYVYTHEDLENLYVLDASNNRIVVIDKLGDFVKEYKSVSLGAASNIAVSEELGKVFAISGSIVYQIDL